MVHGEVNPKFFGFTDETLDTPVNFIVNPASNVNSLSLEYPVNYQPGDPGININGLPYNLNHADQVP
jgi:hypothetical protein